MKYVLLTTAMVAFASPAFAQMTGTSPSSPAGITSQPQTSTPAQDGAMQTPDSAAPATPPAATTPSSPEAIIATEFPAYDKDGNGSLARGEFDAWMTALKEKSGDTAMKPADKMSWLKTAFTTADKDKSKNVSLTELTEYLTAAG